MLVFGSWVHPVLKDLLMFEVSVGNDQLVFSADITIAISCFISAENTSWSLPTLTSNISKSLRTGCTQDPNTSTLPTTLTHGSVICQTYWIQKQCNVIERLKENWNWKINKKCRQSPNSQAKALVIKKWLGKKITGFKIFCAGVEPAESDVPTAYTMWKDEMTHVLE